MILFFVILAVFVLISDCRSNVFFSGLLLLLLLLLLVFFVSVAAVAHFYLRWQVSLDKLILICLVVFPPFCFVSVF